MLSVPSSPTKRRWLDRSAPVLVHLAAPWLVVAAVEAALIVLVANQVLRADQLSIGERISLAAASVAFLAIGVGVIGGPLLLLASAARAHPAARALSTALRVVVIGGALLLYGASWTEFWHVGVFLDRAAFLFWLPNPVQVFHWVYPPLALTVFGAVVVTTAALAWWLPGRVSRVGPQGQRRLVAAAAGLLAVCLATAALGAWSYQERLSSSETPYVIARDNHAGPLLHLYADIRSYWHPAEPVTPAAARDELKIVRRPIVPLDVYLNGVDRSRIKPWNVVMIQIESLRSDQLRAYGGTRDVMPGVDAIARESRVYTNAYIQASHSNYADLVPLSSQYPLRSSEVYTYPEHPIFPRVLIYDVLKGLGYKTAIFSSQNENWGGMINFHRPDRLDQFFHAATFDGPTYAPWEDISFSDWVKQTKGAGSVDDRYTVSAAIKWIESLGSAPFFVHMNLQSSHVPYVVPDDFPRRFGPRTLDFTIMWGRFPRDKVDVVKDRYADSLFYEDTQIARLFSVLRRRGLWDRTLIVIGGDNGEAFYEHGFSSHATALFNEVMKVPMIIRVPDAAPIHDDRPAMFLDVPPTVLDLLGLPPHPGLQGISLLGPQPDPARPMFMIAQTPVVYESAVVRSGFKLLFAERSGSRYLGKYLLFDLVHDPGEQVDVAPSHPSLIDDLSGLLQRWRNEQLAYYSDVGRQQREYPPVLVE